MTIRKLIPSYLDTNHISSLRHEMCDIIYKPYYGTTFYLDDLLKLKKNALKQIKKFCKNHPEIYQYKENQKYWYPYENVDSTVELPLYQEYYPNTNKEITFFCQEGQKKQDYEFNDFLFDPLKLHFFTTLRDIRTMDCSSNKAKEIIDINYKIFQFLITVIGDIVSYNKKTTIEHINEFIKNSKIGEEETRNDPTLSIDLKNIIIKDYQRINSELYLLNPFIITCNQFHLEKKLPKNEQLKLDPKKI